VVLDVNHVGWQGAHASKASKAYAVCVEPRRKKGWVVTFQKASGTRRFVVDDDTMLFVQNWLYDAVVYKGARMHPSLSWVGAYFVDGWDWSES